MHTPEKLQSALDAVKTKRSQIADQGWYLQNCWLVQVKPGGNARTDHKYWQVRSRQPLFDGKNLKHLRADEVEAYKGAIERGRQLKQIDRQIDKLEQQLQQLTTTTDSLTSSSLTSSTPPKTPYQNPILPKESIKRSLPEPPQPKLVFTNIAEQELLVQEVLAKSQALRNLLRHSRARNQQLRRTIKLTNSYPRPQ